MSAALISFGNDLELANAAAMAWLDEVAAAQRAGQAHGVALSGGRITLKFFAAVIEGVKTRGLSLAAVDLFWADERCVPPEDPESNFAAADKFFFQPLGIAKHRIHRIPGEEEPWFAAEVAEAEMRRVTPSKDGYPVLDLIFLGMGEDGHVASLFPGEPEMEPTPQLVYPVYRVIQNAPKPPPNRVTLGYAAIAAARQVWVLASGAGKEAALRESLKPDGKTPLARVLRSHSSAKVFSDIRLG